MTSFKTMKIYFLIIFCIIYNDINCAVVQLEKRHSIGDDSVLSPGDIGNDHNILLDSRSALSQQIPTNQYGSLYGNSYLGGTDLNTHYQPVFIPPSQQYSSVVQPPSSGYGYYQQIQYPRLEPFPVGGQLTQFQRPKITIPYHVDGFGIPPPGYIQYPYALYEPRPQQIYI
ncbi:uncharacterized protein LOC123300888 [Chrysoperla carnea]|uniref:uncharacterized protein LOC123300888 n=1 Tax=Chrysoperla carnea TaxID=189513 RepID=UPI001D092FE4|nr:uncharacterized protein LOC123300888 [Chrysoperla carnea]